MENEKRLDLIDREKVYENACAGCIRHGEKPGECYHDEPCERLIFAFMFAESVDTYSEEQVANLIQQTEKLEAKNKELEKEVSWLKSCLNCKIRKECPRHCGKVVHDCDHWEYGDSAVDAVVVVQRGRKKDG